jgi:hypothetical protein
MAHEAITEVLAPQQQDPVPLQRLKGFSWVGRHVAGLPYLRCVQVHAPSKYHMYITIQHMADDTQDTC